MSGPLGRRAIVVGGGVAGLATSALLARDGWDTTLLEARDMLGGRAGSWEQDGFRFDTGPSWYLMPEVFDHFFRLMGTTADAELDLVRLDPAYRVYAQPTGDGPGERVDVVSGRDAATALFESREPGAGAALDAYLDSAGEAYDLAVEKFLYDTYESTKGLRDPAVLSRLGTLAPLLTRSLAAHVDRRFDDPVLRQILGYPAVFLGGSPWGVPSLFHLMSHLDLDEGVLYPQGGFTALVAAIEQLARAAGVEIRTASPVARIVVDDGRTTGVVLADGTELDADVVVSTADLHRTDTELLPPEARTRDEAWWDKRVPGPGALLLLLGVEGRLPELLHHTLLFAADWRENFGDIFGAVTRVPDPASIYVCRPSATDDSVAPAGHENLFVLVPIPADDRLGRGGVDGAGSPDAEAAADRVIAQIAAWAGIPALAERIVVRRIITPADFEADLGSWRGSALGLAHTLRQSAMFRPRNAFRKARGVYAAGGSALPGIGLPMCLISAELVLKRLRGDRTPGPVAALRRAQGPGAAEPAAR